MKRKQMNVIKVTRDEIIKQLEQELDKDWVVECEDVNNTGVVPLSTVLESLVKLMKDKQHGINTSIQNTKEAEYLKRMASRGTLIKSETPVDPDFVQRVYNDFLFGRGPLDPNAPSDLVFVKYKRDRRPAVSEECETEKQEIQNRKSG
eukprot:TRINITY_DN2802_c0_g1_i1.p2 TRINITY_DN2802_c0_g1~~TRINITY_DN2802_c0_g1_i1.p2  ORF type:complete len:148 (+),score=28.29 TRINITY_DN2802_c0_g1_i1:74-517(+)